MRLKLPLPPFAPDQTVNSGALLVAEGVFPRIDGYGSVGSIVAVSDALGATFQGGYSAIGSDGTAYLLAGTGAALRKLNADGSWTSLVSGLTVSSRWKFAQFRDVAVSVNGTATRVLDLLLGTDSALAGAPVGTSVCVVGDHVVIGQADGYNNRVAWSAFDNHAGWTYGVDQSGFQPMNTGGTVMGLAGGEYGIILQRERIVRMSLTGDADAPFQFDEISSNFGCAAGSTIAQAGRSVFFRSDRGFMALDDGQSLRPIGSEKVDRSFDREVSRDDLERVFTAVDPQNKLVMWGVPGAPGKLWIYNFELDRWSTVSLAFSGLMPGFTTSIGLDDLSVIYPNLDTMPYTLDDPRWTGGNPRLYLFDNGGFLGTLAGDTLPARLDMGYVELTAQRRARLASVRPVCDATSGCTLVVNAKARLGDVGTTKTASTLRASGIIPVRAAGRYMSVSLRIAAGTDWDYIQALEFEVEAGGER